MSVALRAASVGAAAGLLLALGIHAPLGAGTAGFAVALGAIGAVYPGALLAPSGAAPWPAAQEVAVAGATMACAAAGLLLDPLWLVVGFLGHAAWDWAHHAGLGAPVARWYPPFCAAVDLVAAAVLLAALWTA